VNVQEKELPIRIVKKKGGHAGHHGGAWKVAYADFVTAMMSLFIVLWIVGQSKQVKESVASYFKDPGAFESSGNKPLGGGMMQPDAIKDLIKKAEEEEQKKLAATGDTIMKALSKEQDLEKLKKQVEIEVVPEGLRIELLETKESFFFDVGTATLKPDAARVLSIIAMETGRLTNKIIIEGHTDSRQYSQIDGYTNFELSADRANSARRVLQMNGLRNHQIDEIRGYADTKLRDKKDPYDATNRRISIIIKKEEGTLPNGQENQNSHR
jgi:chemotaxis protein MotB